MARPGLHIAWFAVAALLAAAVSVSAEEVSPTSQQGEFFEKSIRPVLAANCQDCHGPQKQQGGLRLDSREALLAGGDSGPAVVPGKPEESLLVKAVHYDDANRQMPPKGQLRSEDIAALTTWVKLGAPWPVRNDPAAKPQEEPQLAASSASTFIPNPASLEHWSFRPVADPPVPVVQDAGWTKQTLDHFILQKLEAAGLRPSELADKRTLIRRATFDLVGLPAAPEEIEAFLADDSSDAFARVVDRLLSSPHYGERWARHWLDVARYGEDQAHTFQARKYPEGFRYRDWLVRAFNDDLPYDQFVVQQIAADLLGDPEDKERLAALGFFALGPVYYGDRQKLDQMDDRIDTLSRGFLGLTVACARCHDHKFDPISTKDYYALAGVIASTDYVEVPLVSQEEVEAAEKALSEEDKKKKVRPKFPLVLPSRPWSR
jgi:mono/diheme cytochrome c family protein